MLVGSAMHGACGRKSSSCPTRLLMPSQHVLTAAAGAGAAAGQV
jgi:hypothetical protein